jgi:hypothetical protein
VCQYTGTQELFLGLQELQTSYPEGRIEGCIPTSKHTTDVLQPVWGGSVRLFRFFLAECTCIQQVALVSEAWSSSSAVLFCCNCDLDIVDGCCYAEGASLFALQKNPCVGC